MSESLFPLISAVVTFHGEGLLAHKTLLGLERMRRFTEAKGITVELVAVLDCADVETTRIVKSSPVLRAGDHVLEVSHRDLSTSRNSGIGIALGKYIGVFDGDDYYSKNWLLGALDVVENKQGDVIVHPECLVIFGTIQWFSSVLDMDDRPDYSLANCLAVNPWIVTSFGRKDLYLCHPYQRTDFSKTGFGYEDWHWNVELVNHGIRHVTAKKTALFYRRKPVSMFTSMFAAGTVIRPSGFFNHPELWGPPAGTTQKVVANEDLHDKTYVEELMAGKAWLEAQWKAGQAELLAKESYLAEVLEGKAWLESEWKALQVELNKKQESLGSIEMQLRSVSAQLNRLQSALPVRVLKKFGVISND